MPKPLSIQERVALLQHCYFVGAGYWPSVEKFALGAEIHNDHLVYDFNCAETMEIEITRLKKPEGNPVLIFFIVTSSFRRVQVTQEDAIWFLENRDEY